MGRHRPGTICPYAGHGWSSSGLGDLVNYGGASRSTNALGSSTGGVVHGRPVDRAPQVWGGISTADLLILVLLVPRPHGSWTLWMITVVLVVAPFGIGWELLSKCRAWINDGTRRCEQPRKGFLHRCADHRSQALTSYDAAGALSLLIGCVNVLVLFSVVLHR